MQTSPLCRWRPLCVVLLLLSLTGGCARQPPNQNALSGVRLRVTMRFNAPVDPINHYYFLINVGGTNFSGDKSAAGPIAVFIPGTVENTSTGNGFATGSSPGTGGFTDFVLFDATGYNLYHVFGNANAGKFTRTGRPVSYVIPDPNSVQTANYLQFDIDFSQLIRDANGSPLEDPNQALVEARAIQFLQVNIVATDNISNIGPTSQEKQVDALGETGVPRNNSVPGSGTSSFLLVDRSISPFPTYSNGTSIGLSTQEPADDVYVNGGTGSVNPTLDLIDWTIQVVQQ